MIELKSEVAGYYKIEAVKPDGTKRVLADWFPNLITDLGLNRMGTRASYSQLLVNCYLGSGNTPPAVTDIQLANLVGSNAVPDSYSYGCASVEPYHTYISLKWRFNPGVADGNLSEVGVGETSTLLFSRALILDGSGVPTTITVLPDEYIDVYYRLNYYAPTADVIGTVDISGVTYDYISRAANVTSSYSFTEGSYYGWGPLDGSMITAPARTPSVTGNDIVAITSVPASLASGSQSSTYIDGSLQSDTVVSFGLTQGNITGGIRSLVLRKGWGSYQIQFTPNIPKDAYKTLSLTLRHSWTRKV